MLLSRQLGTPAAADALHTRMFMKSDLVESLILVHVLLAISRAPSLGRRGYRVVYQPVGFPAAIELGRANQGGTGRWQSANA